MGAGGLAADIEEPADDSGHEVAEVVVGDVDAAVDEGGGGAFVAVHDGVSAGCAGRDVGGGSGGRFLRCVTGLGGGIVPEHAQFIDGGPIAGFFREVLLRLCAGDEAADFLVEDFLGPDTGGRLEGFDHFFRRT